MPDPLALLTKRERQVLMLITEDLSQKEIGFQLQLSDKTVNAFKSKAMHKLNVRTNLQLFKALYRLGLIDVT